MASSAKWCRSSKYRWRSISTCACHLGVHLPSPRATAPTIADRIPSKPERNSPNVSNRGGFFLEERMLPFSRQEHEKVLVTDVLQIRPAQSLPPGSGGFRHVDAVFPNQLLIGSPRILVRRDFPGHVPPIAVPQIAAGDLLHKPLHRRCQQRDTASVPIEKSVRSLFIGTSSPKSRPPGKEHLWRSGTGTAGKARRLRLPQETDRLPVRRDGGGGAATFLVLAPSNPYYPSLQKTSDGLGRAQARGEVRRQSAATRDWLSRVPLL